MKEVVQGGWRSIQGSGNFNVDYMKAGRVPDIKVLEAGCIPDKIFMKVTKLQAAG